QTHPTAWQPFEGPRSDGLAPAAVRPGFRPADPIHPGGLGHVPREPAARSSHLDASGPPGAAAPPGHKLAGPRRKGPGKGTSTLSDLASGPSARAVSPALRRSSRPAPADTTLARRC